MTGVRTGNSFEKSLASHVRCALGTKMHDGSAIGDQRGIESGAMQGLCKQGFSTSMQDTGDFWPWDDVRHPKL